MSRVDNKTIIDKRQQNTSYNKIYWEEVTPPHTMHFIIENYTQSKYIDHSRYSYVEYTILNLGRDEVLLLDDKQRAILQISYTSVGHKIDRHITFKKLEHKDIEIKLTRLTRGRVTIDTVREYKP